MKKQIFSVLLLSSLAANAGIVNFSNGTSLSTAVKQGTCSIIVQQKPIQFFKGSIEASVGFLFLQAHQEDYNQIRQLPVGRELAVVGFRDENTLVFKDKSIQSLGMEHHLSPKLYQLPIGSLENYTDGNLTIKCTDDTPVDF